MGVATPPADRFVRAVIDVLGLDDNPRQPARQPHLKGAGALADRLGISYGTVRRWLEGKNTPGYAETMWMLERCGWLTIDEAVDLPPDPLESIATGVERLTRGQARVLSLLEGQGEAAPSEVREDVPAQDRRAQAGPTRSTARRRK